MKAELKASGTMVIRAETELEAYALGKWAGEFIGPDGECNSEMMLIERSFLAEARRERDQ